MRIWAGDEVKIDESELENGTVGSAMEGIEEEERKPSISRSGDD
jgi:hypothetical protein